MFTVAAVGTNVAALPIGALLDHYGPRVCGLTGAFFLTLGALTMAYATKLPFDGFLFGYLFLISHGFSGYRHLTIAATGQKIIAYAALATVQVQSHLMRRHIRLGDLEGMTNNQAPNPNQFPMTQ